MSKMYKYTDEELSAYLLALNIKQSMIDSIMNNPENKKDFIKDLNNVMETAMTWKRAFDPSVALKNDKLTPEELREYYMEMNGMKRNDYNKR